jgi:hypothetical protein
MHDRRVHTGILDFTQLTGSASMEAASFSSHPHIIAGCAKLVWRVRGRVYTCTCVVCVNKFK